MTKIMRRMRSPSVTVSSFDTLPAGRSRYSMTTFSRRRFLSAAWMVISVSMSKPLDSTGKVLTKGRLNARMPVMTSFTPQRKNKLMLPRTRRLPKLWKRRLFSVK